MIIPPVISTKPLQQIVELITKLSSIITASEISKSSKLAKLITSF